MALETPFRKSNLGQTNISLERLSAWNKLSNDLKILRGGVVLIKAGIRKFYPCHLVVSDLRLETKGSILDVI